MACRRITQETFDAVVKENIDEFDMDTAEALREAVEQFESQGVDLSCIVKTVPTAGDHQTEEHEVLQALESLQIASDSSMAADLKRFTEQCSLGFAQRHLAAQKDAYPTIISCCRTTLDEQEALLAALSALAALTDGQPDLLDSEGKDLLVSILGMYQTDPALMLVAIRTVRHFCLKHEQNRQDLVKAGVLPLLTGTIKRHTGRSDLVKEACNALRYMTFDDDIRVPFGQAHEHAKMIVMEHNGLKVIVEAAKAHPENTPVLSVLCATLSSLAVRNEFCQDICDLGGLKFMMTLLADSYESQELTRQVLSALRAIAGNDDVKDAVTNAGGVQLIVIAMNRHMGNAQVCEQGCAALSVVALRKPNNCQVIMEEGGALAALLAMKTHPDEVNVQKQGCMLLRNLVARMTHFNQPILEMGAEALIAQALAAHRDCGDLAKAALRDLGCQVELRELWTGKKGSLTRD
ncbi:armadillo repeat-containing protein 6 [Oncorhynchus nerka]|uniref:armadillo repeat-containing protein 6 n=1 Tax=Oncorhynchus nerka TaxID=8023 RepID=UPI001131FA57|nr:armadillo repeat-containing protein 6 [Oncorhynchus nerka]XP_035655279.1 armadillo repeat-containing protein 6 [Oncorhynchus keta]XP_046177540.1 armadillo repeat-containing protein 6 [Oncorhynchus gorbuscha]